ncbi:Chaperone protein DnaJ [Rubrobacter xylanophilus DSM 9941]|uniref:molecular chaperone DnaJ n=1 Tax=Rubrobacter xylanophilus TaxID=49319 RepID=UPI001C641A67|nr:molecular chaperone DnaJ [Rubrobacter xylanophilus]QYJ14749.1 Chaperone protein DnaJ [Rubrobacter xylanophilus DSM 9941]
MPARKRDYYEVLGLPRDASEQDIKRAYRRLARKCHPDANPDDPNAEERFKELTEAYEVLSNPESRRAYDTYGHQVPRGSAGTRPGGDPFGGFQDIFEAFFGDRFGDPFFDLGRQRRQPSRGADTEAEVEVDLHEAAFGTERDVKVQTIRNCPVCEGLGGTGRRICGTCGGSGVVRGVRETLLGRVVHQQTCSACGGSGQVVTDRCEECRGSGRVSEVLERRIRIPAGIEDGMRLRVPGWGHAGEPGATPGDLYVNVRVKEHPELMRDGEDLIHRVSVTFVQAALGTEVEVPTLEGSETVRIEPGTQPGTTLVLRGEGMPRMRGGGRGDLKVVVDVMVPTRLTGEQRKLLERFEAASGEETYNGRSSSFFDRLRGVFR